MIEDLEKLGRELEARMGELDNSMFFWGWDEETDNSVVVFRKMDLGDALVLMTLLAKAFRVNLEAAKPLLFDVKNVSLN